MNIVKKYALSLVIVSMAFNVIAEPTTETKSINQQTFGQKVKAKLIAVKDKAQEYCTPTNIALAAIASVFAVRLILHARKAWKPKNTLGGQRLRRAPVEPPVPQRVYNHAPEAQQCQLCVLTGEEEIKRPYALATLQCQHIYCRDHLEQLVNTAITDNNTNDLKCPNEHCNDPANNRLRRKLNIHDIHTITNNNNHMRDAILGIMRREWFTANTKQCPTPDCGYVFMNEQNIAQEIRCPQCRHEYCASCLIEHEEDMTCEQALGERDHATGAWINNNTKQCPRCHTNIEKNGGCNHITCTRQACRHEFCWVCLNRWNNNHYNCNGLLRFF